MYCIYVHINKINGKMYIGQTSQDVKIRWNYGNGYIDSPKFYSAIKKYGWNNFKHIILIDNLTLDEANIYEEAFIKEYNTIRNGYNIKYGGNNKTFPDEVKIKISKTLSGTKHTDESRKHMSDAHKGKYFEHPTSNKVVMCSNGKCYPSITAAGKDVGVNRVTVGNICNGRLDNWKGITFWFLSEMPNDYPYSGE